MSRLNYLILRMYYFVDTALKMKFSIIRSSHRRSSIKITVLKNFAIFTGKHLCWSLSLKKSKAFRPAALLKRDSNTGCLFVNIAKFLRKSILKNICEMVFLHYQSTSFVVQCLRTKCSQIHRKPQSIP